MTRRGDEVAHELKPIVSVIIVVYNSAEVIPDCISILSGAGYDPSEIEILLIDNNSSDGSTDIATRINPQIHAIRNRENLGFSRAVNRAAALAKGETLLLLNPDATIQPDHIVELARRLSQDKSIGITAPLLLQGEGDLATIGAGRRPTVFRMLLHSSGLSRLGKYAHALEGHYLFSDSIGSNVKQVDWVTGGCLMTTRELWDRIGGLSDRWFMYAEDIDFCMRVRQAGLKITVVPSLIAHHAVGGSSSSVDGRVNTAWIENLFDMYCVTMAPSRLHPLAWKFAVLAGFMGRIAAYRMLMPDSPERANQMKRYSTYARALWNTRSSFGERQSAQDRF